MIFAPLSSFIFILYFFVLKLGKILVDVSSRRIGVKYSYYKTYYHVDG